MKTTEPVEMQCPIPGCGAVVRVEPTGQHRQVLIRGHENGHGGVCRASETPPRMWGA